MRRAIVVLGVLLGACATVNAQDPGHVGITMGYPGSIGVLWHVADSVAVRPEISFSTASSDNEFGADTTNVSGGASALFYVAKWDQLRAYLSPRLTYGHTTSDSAGTIGIGLKNSTFNVVGSFGAQYTPHKRFAVFGETGLGYSRSTSTTTTVVVPIVLPPGFEPTRPTTTSTLTGFGTRTGVGVISTSNRAVTKRERAAVAALAVATLLLYGTRLEHTPAYLHDAEVLFGLQAHAIATTARDVSGRLLPLYFQMQPIGDNVWFHPVLVYFTALFVSVLPFAEWSVRLPSAALGTLNVVLLYVLARRIFGRKRDAALAAILLMLTPAHFIHSRIAMDYLYPVPFVLGWLIALSHYLEKPRAWILFTAATLLGIGVYTYIASVVMMPVYLALTLLALWWTRNLSPRTAIVAGLGFALPLMPIPLWLAYHPTVVADTLSRYRIGATPTRLSGAAGRLSLYWYFWDPTYLFLTGGYANVVNSTRHAGVFALPLVVPVVAGIRRLAGESSSTIKRLVLAGFFSAPVAACLAVPEPYAVDRELALLPFGILIAVYGFLQLRKSRRRFWRAAGIAALALVPVHFAFFYYDYFTDYRRHSAIWFELNHREALEAVAGLAGQDAGSTTRAIYLPIDKDPYMDSYWQFTLAKLRRGDLRPRTVLYQSATMASAPLPQRSVVLMRRGDGVVERLVASGELRIVRIIPEIGDPPEFVILER